MTGWDSKTHNPLTQAPVSQRIEPKATVDNSSDVTINGQSITLPWPFLVADADAGYPSVDILTSE